MGNSKISHEGGVWRYHCANRGHTLHHWSVLATALYGGCSGRQCQASTREMRREAMDTDPFMF